MENYMTLQIAKIEISNKNLNLLKEFIDNIGKSSDTFRYFKNRDITCVKNHITTIVFLLENVPVAYGHLDKDGDKIWLGIATREGFTGKGFGKIMMNELILRAKQYGLNKIYLSVDTTNKVAIDLYKKFQFKNTGETGKMLFMERLLDNK
tara:strand:+ start:291 stop:740 length:450 start_codon:yes stop_codon:yes gene_type:complete